MESSDTGEVARLLDLQQRMGEKAVLLSEMADACTVGSERTRLRGKAEGVYLALSFVDEAIRDMRPIGKPWGWNHDAHDAFDAALNGGTR